MRLAAIFGWEVESQWRRWSMLFYAAGIVAMTVLATGTFLDDAQRDGVFMNAPAAIAGTTIILTIVGLLVTAAVAGEAATRDVQARMDPLLYTTPLPKTTYLAGRFLGAFVTNALLLALVPVTLLFVRFFPNVEPGYVAPFRLSAFVEAYLFIALPNAFITTALLFALVLLTRRAMLGYLGAAVLFLNTLVQDEVIANALGRWDLAKLLDPFGFIAMRILWRSWTPTQRNALNIDATDTLLTNRLLWLGFATGTLLLVYARFKMAHHAPKTRRLKEPPPTANRQPPTRPRIHRTFSRKTRARQFTAIATHAYRELITSRAALLLPFVAFLVFKVAPELLEVGLGTPARPTTGRLVMLITRFAVTGVAIGPIIAFFAGQLVWRERDAREHDIAGAAPVPDVLTFLGKFTGLAMLLATLQALLMIAGMFVQIAYGWDDFQPGLYLRVLFGMKLADHLLFAALAMAVHVIVDQKHVATAISILVWLGGSFGPQVGIEHNLLLYGGDPGFGWSDLTGFGGAIEPWLAFKLYWTGWALLLALLARLFWVRGHEANRIATARDRLTRPVMVITTAALAIITGAGTFILYNTNVLNEFDPKTEWRSAEYERRYEKYESLAQPVVAATTLHIDLHPAQKRADISGTYRVVNRTSRSIDAIHLVTHRLAPPSRVVFDRPAYESLVDREVGYRIYKLVRPLSPGDSLRLDFDVHYAARGFTNRGVAAAITDDGSFFEHRPDDGLQSWLPSVGYRKKGSDRGLEHIDLETIISTDPEEIAVAPGALRRTWTANGRRWFHYATDAPIRNGFPILSARYAVRRARWHGVDIEVLYHPRHAWNVERMLRSAQASFDYYTRHFGPYPHRQLRIVEFPSPRGNQRLTSHPGTIVWAETFAFAQPENDPRQIDFPYAVLAHEMGHQWWGNQVVPARADGAALISESLAWYGALNVVEHSLGRPHLDRLMSVMRASYLTPHETPEEPLLRANDWLAVYRTGALAMYSLRETIGEERVNAALRAFLDEYRSGRAPFPTSLDLYRHLRAVTPVASQPLLKDLFEDVTFWDLSTRTAGAVRVAGGYRVTLDVEAYKIKAGPGGREWRVPLDENIEVSVTGDRGAALYRRPHRIRSGHQLITVLVPAKPKSAGIDTRFRLLDRNRDDNAREVM